MRIYAPGSVGTCHEIACYQRHADLCKVLVDPKRLMLLDALRDGEASVSALAERIGMSLTNASQHLGVMRHAGLVAPRRVGTTVYYRISEPTILDAYQRWASTIWHSRSRSGRS